MKKKTAKLKYKKSNNKFKKRTLQKGSSSTNLILNILNKPAYYYSNQNKKTKILDNIPFIMAHGTIINKQNIVPNNVELYFFTHSGYPSLHPTKAFFLNSVRNWYYGKDDKHCNISKILKEPNLFEYVFLKNGNLNYNWKDQFDFVSINDMDSEELKKHFIISKYLPGETYSEHFVDFSGAPQNRGAIVNYGIFRLSATISNSKKLSTISPLFSVNRNDNYRLYQITKEEKRLPISLENFVDLPLNTTNLEEMDSWRKRKEILLSSIINEISILKKSNHFSDNGDIDNGIIKICIGICRDQRKNITKSNKEFVNNMVLSRTISKAKKSNRNVYNKSESGLIFNRRLTPNKQAKFQSSAQFITEIFNNDIKRFIYKQILLKLNTENNRDIYPELISYIINTKVGEYIRSLEYNWKMRKTKNINNIYTQNNVYKPSFDDKHILEECINTILSIYNKSFHIKNKVQETPFAKCEKCDMLFYSKENLLKHWENTGWNNNCSESVQYFRSLEDEF